MVFFLVKRRIIYLAYYFVKNRRKNKPRSNTWQKYQKYNTASPLNRIQRNQSIYSLKDQIKLNFSKSKADESIHFRIPHERACVHSNNLLSNTIKTKIPKKFYTPHLFLFFILFKFKYIGNSIQASYIEYIFCRK